MTPDEIRYQLHEESAYAENWRRLARQARQVFDESYALVCEAEAADCERRACEHKARLDACVEQQIDAHIEAQEDITERTMDATGGWESGD